MACNGHCSPGKYASHKYIKQYDKAMQRPILMKIISIYHWFEANKKCADILYKKTR